MLWIATTSGLRRARMCVPGSYRFSRLRRNGLECALMCRIICWLGGCFLIALVGCEAATEDYRRVGSCAALHERIVACDADAAVSRPEFLPVCNQYPVDYRDFVACGAEQECPGFRACMRAAREGADPMRRSLRVGSRRERLEAAMRSGDWGDADRLCHSLQTDLDPGEEVQRLCRERVRRAVAALTVELLDLRDKPGSASAHIARCRILYTSATLMSEVDHAAARQLCSEVELALSTERLLEQVRRQEQRTNPKLPAGCTLAIARTQKVAGAYARARRTQVITRCFVELGVRIVATREAQGSLCDVELRRLHRAVGLYGLHESRLAEVLQPFNAVCEEADPAGPAIPAGGVR